MSSFPSFSPSNYDYKVLCLEKKHNNLPDEVTGGDASCFRLSRTTELVTGDVSETGEPFLTPDWFTLLGGLGADTLRSENAASLPIEQR